MPKRGNGHWKLVLGVFCFVGEFVLGSFLWDMANPRVYFQKILLGFGLRKETKKDGKMGKGTRKRNFPNTSKSPNTAKSSLENTVKTMKRETPLETQKEEGRLCRKHSFYPNTNKNTQILPKQEKTIKTYKNHEKRHHFST